MDEEPKGRELCNLSQVITLVSSKAASDLNTVVGNILFAPLDSITNLFPWEAQFMASCL